MVLIFLFILSGLVIATMLVAKRIEEKKKQGVFVLRFLKHGDVRARDSYNRALHYYSISKDRAAFWLKKLLPLKMKSYWNKFQSLIKEAANEYAGDIRNSKLLRRSDGISEFFKTISDIEKGAGEINEVLEETTEVVVQEFKESVPTPKPKKRTYNRKKVKVN